MTTRDIDIKVRKKEKIKISNIYDFKKELKKEGYKVNYYDEEKFKEDIIKIFKVDNDVIEHLYKSMDKEEITYRANNVSHFIDYMEKIVLFEREHYRLCEKISEIKKLRIDRVEYERKPNSQDNVEHILKAIEEIKDGISGVINEKEKCRLEYLEKEIGKNYLYAKEKYNEITQVKTISIDIPKEIDNNYIKPLKGSVEYHQHLSNNIPRMKRLVKNMSKYIKIDEKDNLTFKINQSSALQDSINIAVVEYDNKEFKAISGSNEINDYCKAPPLEKQFFKSNKVNKLGKLGTGYNRINDSEKKIFEEIHKQIKAKKLNNKGNLTLYSKWEPCPSCYYVINQFCRQYPDIKVQVKYIKRYGEN